MARPAELLPGGADDDVERDDNQSAADAARARIAAREEEAVAAQAAEAAEAAAEAATEAAAAAAAYAAAEVAVAAAVKIIEDLITERTVIFLRAADMQTTTENQIRKSVEVELSTDLTEQKLLVRSIVTMFLADPDQFKDVGKTSKADRKRN